LAGVKKIPRLFLIAFLNFPCCETPKYADEKKSSKTTEGGEKNSGKQSDIFVMSSDMPDWLS
jgi:hypothetical protein